MKKQIISITLILILGVLVIALPGIFRERSSVKKENNISNNKIYEGVQSKIETLDFLEVPFDEMESEAASTEQIYIENVELLYKNLSFNQVEKIKESITTYLLRNFHNVKKCSIMYDVVLQKSKNVSFELLILEKQYITVTCAMDSKGEITDISMLQSK